MAQFTSAAEFHDFKKYVPLLKKAILTVKPGELKKFAYFKEYPFAEKTQPCVLVDFTPQCLDEVKSKVVKPTAEGVVGLTTEDELRFDPEIGSFQAETVKKLFAKIGGIKNVFVDSGAPIGTVAASVAPQKVGMPPLPPLPQAPKPPQGQAGVAPGAKPPLARPAAIAPQIKPVLAPAKRSPHALRLPLNVDEQKALLAGYIKGLSKAKLPGDPARQTALLDEAQKLADRDKYADALMLLNSLTRDVEYPGVDEWALDGASRKYEIELLGEKLHALLNLINSKRKKPTDWQNEQAAIVALLTKPTNFNGAIGAGLLAVDPVQVKKDFDEWAPLVAKQRELATKLRKAWLDDQKSRFKSQAKGNKNHLNVKVAGAYGTDAMLELAQMAEVQALQYKKAPANANDPVAQGDWHTKLDLCELAAIYGYSTADYTPVSQVLRDKPKNTDAEKAALEANKKKFNDYIEAAKNGLAKLPAYSGGPVVRCTKSLWQDTIDAITATGEHVEKSLMSTGKKKVSGFGDIVWEIDKVTTGKDISMFSLHQSEGEVLFPPNSKFRFVKAEVEGDGGKTTINDHRQFAANVTQNTTVAKISWVQV